MPEVTVNRAPVLTLWATVVAERFGYSRDEALTLGKAIAGASAAAKARSLGLTDPHRKRDDTAPQDDHDEIEFLGRRLAVVRTDEGLRAIAKGEAVDPEGVTRYLRARFGDALPQVERSMRALARSRSPKALAAEGFRLYESFRPQVAADESGWGAEGVLDLDRIKSLTTSQRSR